MRVIIFLVLFLSLSYSSIYELKVKNAYNQDINFEDFEDTILVIFVTNKEIKPDNQLRKLNKLYNTYKDEDISFVGFAIKEITIPKNDFCVLNYGVDFEMIGEMNNKISKLEKYILNIYESETLEPYAPILVHNRKILRFSNIYELKDVLMKRFDSEMEL